MSQLKALLLLTAAAIWLVAADDTTKLQSDEAAFGTLVGTVTDSTTGEPLLGALVIVPGTTLGVETDSLGRFEFPRVPIGTYKIKVGVTNYHRMRSYTGVPIHADDTTLLNVRLQYVTPLGLMDSTAESP